MATIRTSSLASIFRFTAQPATASRCSKCLKAQRCPFSSTRTFKSNQGSKRPLMTESVLRNQTLESPPLTPPRNTGVPETSIASDQHSSWPPKAPWSTSTLPEVNEEKAQKSSFPPPAAPQTEIPSSVAAKPAKKSKLRPRKAAMKLTPAAVEHLRALHDQPDGKFIRVGVKNRGCSGLAYHLEYVEKPGAFDETVEQDGVKVLIDSKALFSIIGSEMDWAEDKLAARFVFKNPNISELIFYHDTTSANKRTADQCGCGESFSIS